MNILIPDGANDIGGKMKFNLFLSILLLYGALLNAETISIHFDDQADGQLPKGFTTALTGKGKIGSWKIAKESTAPSAPNVLAQTDMDQTSYRFPLCIFDGVSAKDVVVSVKFKPVKGSEDQAAGIVWRYRDQNNYYIVRANALENNVVLYKVENGKRTDLPLKGEGRTYGKKAPVPSGKWSTLAVTAKSNLFEVTSNGQKLYEVEDSTFVDAGKVGLWTKADSFTYFDDLQIDKIN
jgi:hypothetical protein